MSTTPKAISRAAVAASGGLSQLVRLPGLDLASSLLASTASGWRGSMVRVAQAEAVEGILLYEFEGCPFCRVVRAATALALGVCCGRRGVAPVRGALSIPGVHERRRSPTIV